MEQGQFNGSVNNHSEIISNRLITSEIVYCALRLFSSDAFFSFNVRIRTEFSEHVNSFIDAY